MQEDSLRSDSGTSASRTGSSPASTEPSFFQRFLGALFGGSNPEHEKRRQLKRIAKEINKQHYKFFRTKGEEALPNMARFFYEIYRTVAPAQVFLQNSENSSVMRSIIIDSFLSKEQLALQERLTEPSINERAKKTPLKDLVPQLKEEIVGLYGFFDDEKTHEIDMMYGLLLNFIKFINFDYYFLLKKFDSNLVEHDFAYKPKFEPISGEYVGEDLKDFLEVFAIIDTEADWRRLFGIIKQFRNVDVVAVDAWNKVLDMLRDVHRSGILELIVRYLEKDPAYMETGESATAHIVEPYLSRVKTQTDVVIQKIVQEKRNGKVDELAVQIFGTTAVARMKNYTDKANVFFQKKMLGGFTRVQAMNYLKAFLVDYAKKDIRELVELLLIRGKWSTTLSSQQLSESFHELLNVIDDLLAFDDSLADDGELGLKLRNAINRCDRNKEDVKLLRALLKEINDIAQTFINRAAQGLISTGKNLKNLLDDYGKTPHEIIINWKEIESASEVPVRDRFLEVYKKIYYFVQLLQFFVSEPL